MSNVLYLTRSKSCMAIKISDKNDIDAIKQDIDLTLEEVGKILINTYRVDSVDLIDNTYLLIRQPRQCNIPISISNDIFNEFNVSSNVLSRCIREIEYKIKCNDEVNNWCLIL